MLRYKFPVQPNDYTTTYYKRWEKQKRFCQTEGIVALTAIVLFCC